MRDIDFGKVHLNLAKIMAEQGVSINKLSQVAQMQRTQLKAYMHNDVQRVDLSVLARICYALDCSIADLLIYEKADDSRS